MKLTVVKEVPKKAAYKSILNGYLAEFMKMNVKVVKINFNDREYKCASSCQSAFRRAAIAGGYPVTVTARNKEVYLIRRDMD